jgi:phage tail sheath protein FI
MPEYLAPGEILEEVSYRAKSIDGVETSTAAFIGRARPGPQEPVGVTAFSEYERLFRPLDREQTLADAVRAFFGNGGSRAWVVPVPDTDPLSRGLETLGVVRDVGLLCLPGESDPEVLGRALEFAERQRMFLIVDAMDLDPKAAVRIAHALANEKGARVELSTGRRSSSMTATVSDCSLRAARSPASTRGSTSPVASGRRPRTRSSWKPSGRRPTSTT